ncbi:MAG: hypothetical protein J1E97_00335 [Muribaculaceae bacterium]|nr:hypothetical protein [Muribaculaceae bacterium]
MIEFTNFKDAGASDTSMRKPKNTTLEIIRQYARVYTPLTSIAFSQLIIN